MKSKLNVPIDDEYNKKVELIWKVFWFIICLFALPTIGAFTTGVIFFWVIYDFYNSVAIGLIFYVFIALFCYKICDKYRKKPFFSNRENNLIARINILFLFTLISQIIPLIFDIFTLYFTNFSIFGLFPIISFLTIYILVFYYYYHQPTDFFDSNEKIFKNSKVLQLSLKQPDNIVVIFNLFIGIMFLSIVSSGFFSNSILFIINLLFYIFTFFYTRSERRSIKKAIFEGTHFLTDLIRFKNKFVVSIVSLIFTLVILLPIITIKEFSDFYTILFCLCLMIICVIIYLKLRFYIYFYFNTRLSNIINIERDTISKEDIEKKINKIKKFNSIFSGIFVGLYLLFAFLVLFLMNNGIFILFQVIFVTPFFYILTYFEEKLHYCSKKENRFVNLANTIIMLASISFGLLIIIPLNIQFIIFFVSLIFILEIFVKVHYFKKEAIIIIQNILSVSIYLIFTYSLILFYLNQAIISSGDPFSNVIFLVLINTIIIAGAFLFSFYILYIRRFYGKHQILFNFCIIINFLVIESSIYFLVNFIILVNYNQLIFLNSLLISIITFPSIIITFLILNRLFKIFSYEKFMKYFYNAFWFQIFAICSFISIIIINDVIGLPFWIIFDILLFFGLLNFQLKFGKRLGKVKESTIGKFQKINSIVMFSGMILSTFLLFWTIIFIEFLDLWDNSILSIYISLLAMSILINILSYKTKLFPKKLCTLITSLTLCITSILASYYAYIPILNTSYVYIIPTSLFCVVFYLPILYLLKKGFKVKFLKKVLFIDSILLSIFLCIVPSILAVELFNYGIINIFNFTLFMILSTLLYLHFIGKKIDISEKIIGLIGRLQILILLGLTGTAIFLYTSIFLAGTVIQLLIPLMCSSIYLYFPSYISFKKEYFKPKIVKFIVISNNWFITALVASIPSFFSVELILLGAITLDPLLIINTINATFFILLGLLSLIDLIYKKVKTDSKLPNQIQVLILFAFSGTLVFYYPFLLLQGTYYAILLPLMLTSCYFFIPSLISYKKEYMKKKIAKYFIICNSILLSFLIIAIPTYFGLEFGIRFTNFFIITPTIILSFLFLKHLEYISKKVRLSKNFIINLEIAQIFVWLFMSVIISISYVLHVLPLNLLPAFLFSTPFLIWSCMNIYNLIQIESLRQNVYKCKDSRYSHVKINEISEYYSGGLFIGINFLLSLLFVSLAQAFVLIIPLPSELQIWINIFYMGIFFGSLLALLTISSKKIKTKFLILKDWIILVSWLFIKAICFILIAFFPLTLDISIKLAFGVVTFTILTPITNFYLKKVNIVSEWGLFLLRRITSILFMAASVIFYTGLFLSLILQITYFFNNIFLTSILLCCNLSIIFNFFLLKFKSNWNNESTFEVYKFYFSSLILMGSMIYPLIFLILLTCAQVFLERSEKFLNRVFTYIILSVITFINIYTLLDVFGVLYTIPTNNITIYIGIYAVIYITIMLFIITGSILLNLKKRNDLDLILLYIMCSLWAFVFLSTYSNIMIFYNFTISIFIFLLLTGITLYRRGDERFKKFIRLCFIFAIIGVISYLSYKVLFINPDPNYFFINQILIFTLTSTIAAIAIIILYKDLKDEKRQRYFYPTLLILIISFPTFIGLILSTYSPFSLAVPVSLTISLNIGIFLFYISVGVYQWEFSKKIWETGWWMWNFLPIVNVFLLYQGVAGIDVYSNALYVFGNPIGGGIIITISIFILLYLPILYKLFKKHFYHLLILVLGESVFLILWLMQNIFVNNIILITLSVVLIVFLLFLPILYKISHWRIVSRSWLWILTPLNILFITNLLIFNGIPIFNALSVGTIILGIFLIIYSFFPNIENKILLAVISYLLMILGIFFLIFFITFDIIEDFVTSINIAFIIIAFSMFSSKYLKFEKSDPKRIIHLSISLILIFNFFILTLRSFMIIPGFELFAIFLAIAVLGGSFFVFNHYNMMIKQINKAYPWTILAVGTSLAICSLCFIINPILPWRNWAITISIFILFAYYIFYKIRFILWYFFPIPIAFLGQDLFHYFIGEIPLLWIFTLTLFYLTIFQAIINTVSYLHGDRKNRVIMKIFKNKNHIKIHNFICFTINSFNISLLISIFTPLSIEYQILEFLIIISISFILTIKYTEISKMMMAIKNKQYHTYLIKLYPILYFILYIEITLMSFVPIFQFIGLFESILISLAVLYVLTLLDIHLIKKVSKRDMFLINTISYFVVSIFLSIYLNAIIEVVSPNFIWLTSSIFLTMHFYTIYAATNTLILFGGFKNDKSYKLKVAIQNLLFILIFGVISLYFSSMVTTLIVSVFELLYNIQIIILITFSSFFMFALMNLVHFLTLLLNKTKEIKQKFIILFVSFSTFQVSLGILLPIAFALYGFLFLFTVLLIIFIETILLVYSFYCIGKVRDNEKSHLLTSKAYGLIVFFLYLEISLLFLSYSLIYLGIFESILISQIILFVIIGLEITVLQKHNQAKMRIVQTTSYFTISLAIFGILYNYSQIDWIFLTLAPLVFVTMQFYTNYLIFNIRSRYNSGNKILNEGKATKIMEDKYLGKRIIGCLFYVFLIFFIVHAFILLKLNEILIFICTSGIIHVLMIIDQYLFKFTGKRSNPIKLISWGLLMIFSWISLFLVFRFYLSTITITVVPLIIFIIILELAYMFKLLGYSKAVQKRFNLIKKGILLALYINFTTWPLFFLELNNPINFYIIFSSFGVFHLIMYIDKYLKVFKDTWRSILRSISFLAIGAFISIMNFFFLQDIQIFVPNFNLVTNLNITILIILIFLGIAINPFKMRHLYSFIYWLGISISSSLSLIYGLFLNPVDVFSNIFLGLIIFSIFIIMFFFIFMIEEVLALFRNFLEVILDKLKKIKQAFKNAYRRFVIILKKYFRIIYTIIIILFGILIFYLISSNFNLIWYHALLISIAVVIPLMYVVSPARKEEDPVKQLKSTILYCIAIWVSLISVLLTFFSYLPISLINSLMAIFIILVSIIILGAICLVIIYHMEKEGKISIKYRYYTTLFFLVMIVVAIIIGVLLSYNIFNQVA